METPPLIEYSSKYKEVLHRLILENIKEGTPQYILDIGCGKGDDLRKVSFINGEKRVYGIDISFESLKIASRKIEPARNFKILQARAETLPFKEDSFDIVISSEVIEHLNEPEKLIREIRRLLKRRGVFIVTTPSRFTYTRLIGKMIPSPFKKTLRKFVYHISPGKDENPHIREYSRRELKKMFQDNEFIVERIESGVLRVPVWPLFDKFSFLLLGWKCLDRLVDKLPWGSNLKHNIVMMGRKLSENTIKHVLVINLGGVGDLVLSSPALRGLRNLYPQAEISMLVSSRAHEIVRGSSYIDKIFALDVGYAGVIPFGKILRNFKVLMILRKKRFDLAINMRTLVSKSTRKIKFLIDIIGAKTNVGRNTEGRGYFYNIKIPETEVGKKHERDYGIDTVKALGAEVTDKSIDFDIDEETIEKVSKILERESISEKTILIGLHPGGRPSRRWPVENFARVVGDVQVRIPCRFVITGGKDEVSLAQELMKTANTEIVNLAGKLNLKELGGLIKRCNLYISNDSGPMHIAAILKTPLVAIFGPGDLAHYDPRSVSEEVVVLYKKVGCSPCPKIRCKSMKCLKRISSQEVIEATLRLMRYENKRGQG